MNNLSVVIPSKTSANLIPCIAAVREKEPAVRIIVAADLTPGESLDLRLGLAEVSGIGCMCVVCRIVAGAKPFIFSRNCNFGMRAAEDDDVIILNDDAILETPGGFTAMQIMAEERPEFGIIASACNNVGNINQHRQTESQLRAEPRMVCFVCVLIPRRTIEAVGMLDERFINYGLDDDDFCLRVRNAGLKIGIFDGCVVDHSKLTSTFRGNGAGDYRPNLKLFIEKWGVDNRNQPKETSPFKELFPA